MFDIGGVMKGLNAGFIHMGRVMEIAVDAYHKGKQQQLQDALHVQNLWAQEIAGTAGNPVGAAIGGDPFHGSRMAAQALEAKYPKI